MIGRHDRCRDLRHDRISRFDDFINFTSPGLAALFFIFGSFLEALATLPSQHASFIPARAHHAASQTRTRTPRGAEPRLYTFSRGLPPWRITPLSIKCVKPPQVWDAATSLDGGVVANPATVRAGRRAAPSASPTRFKLFLITDTVTEYTWQAPQVQV